MPIWSNLTMCFHWQKLKSQQVVSSENLHQTLEKGLRTSCYHAKRGTTSWLALQSLGNFKQVPTRKPTRLNHIANTPDIRWLHCHCPNGSKSPIRGALTKPILSEGLTKRKQKSQGCQWLKLKQVPRCIDPVQWLRVVFGFTSRHWWFQTALLGQLFFP